jgi:hypothetical protein
MDKMPLRTLLSAANTPENYEAFSRAIWAGARSLTEKNIPKDQRMKNAGHLEATLMLEISKKKGKVNAAILDERRRFVRRVVDALRTHEAAIRSGRAAREATRVQAISEARTEAQGP